MGKLGAAPSLDVSDVRNGEGHAKCCAPMLQVRIQGGFVTYHGIDRCDRCGKPLEDGQWLVGLCQSCEEALNKKRVKAAFNRRQ